MYLSALLNITKEKPHLLHVETNVLSSGRISFQRTTQEARVIAYWDVIIDNSLKWNAYWLDGWTDGRTDLKIISETETGPYRLHNSKYYRATADPNSQGRYEESCVVDVNS